MSPSAPPHRHRGAVLIVSLLVLIVLTMLVLAATRSSTLQERMTGNAREQELAFQTAEAALRQGESLLDLVTVPPPTGTNGWYRYGSHPAPDWLSPETWDNPGFGRMDYSNAGMSSQFAIEELPPMQDAGGSLEAGGTLPESTMYRISARGYGPRGDVFVILQSTYRR